MRSYGAMRNTDKTPMPPDTVQTLLLAAGVAQALDWPNSTGGAATNAAAGDSQLVRFTFATTAGIPVLGMVNLYSTNCNAPSSGSSASTGTTAGSTGNSVPVCMQGEFQIMGYSTGWSAACPVSAYCIAEIWSK
jgi:hypothetical protein